MIDVLWYKISRVVSTGLYSLELSNHNVPTYTRRSQKGQRSVQSGRRMPVCVERDARAANPDLRSGSYVRRPGQGRASANVLHLGQELHPATETHTVVAGIAVWRGSVHPEVSGGRLDRVFQWTPRGRPKFKGKARATTVSRFPQT